MPESAAVIVTVHSDVGQVSANGFTREANTYTNEAHGGTPVTLRIDVTMAVGQVDLETVA